MTELADRLRREGIEADASSRRRAEYSTDASNYRVLPQVVVFPRHRDEVLHALQIARDLGAPVTSRGGGTSVAGNSIGPGVVIDFSRHLNRVLSLDPQQGTAQVEAGCVLATLQREAARHGLRFGPDPSTWTRCTLGGMIGNNACGPRSLAYGRTADNVRSLSVVDGNGRQFEAGSDGEPVPGLDHLVDSNLALLRTELGRFPRQLSGYSLEHLLPENGRHLARALVGTEGTCVTVLDAELSLVPIATAPAMLVLGYPDMPSAADDIPVILRHPTLAIEGLDAGLVEAVAGSRGPASPGVSALPQGEAWLLIEVAGESESQAQQHAMALQRECAALDATLLPAGPTATAIWRMREDGAGLAGQTRRGRQAWPGLEDAAVPPEQLGAYLRDFQDLCDQHDVEGLTYGHFGEGCLHVRLDLPLDRDPSSLNRFMVDAAALIASHGGSMSGEHGDGRARSELLPTMYSPETIDLFAGFKHLFDPDEHLNPGVVVRPRPLSADLRRPHAAPLPSLGLAFASDGADLTRAVHRCTGVGKCRADNSAAGGFMCPSYLATRDEKDSTRGRARVLQEMLNGAGVVPRDFGSPEVQESLDLCLSCKACASDCPAGVDMAALKAEVQYRRFRRRLRPISHYSLGWLPRWARVAALAPQAVNLALRPRWAARLVRALGGIDQRRSIPTFATVPFRRWWRRRSAGADAAAGTPTSLGRRPQVVLWVDTFSQTMTPAVAQATVAVLEDAGFEVIVPADDACCGLPWISTGQLDGARRQLRRLISTLGPYATSDIPILGVEPSCTAVLRSDLHELFPEDPVAAAITRQTVTLAELLTQRRDQAGWAPPDLSGVDIVVQPHCHHHAVLGFDNDMALLESTGATLRKVSGCCGLAGNFGMERGHYEVSVAVAENGLLPALDAAPGAVLLADGFSCRIQADQLRGVDGLHLAQLLADATRRDESGQPTIAV